MSLISCTLFSLSLLFICCCTAIAAKITGRTHYLVSLYVVVLVVSGFLARKIVSVGSLELPSGTFLVASLFLITDILSEFWGKKESETAVYSGFIAYLVSWVSIEFYLSLDCVPTMTGVCSQYNEFVNLAPRIFLASIVAYVTGQYTDINLFHWVKRKTNGRELWLRNNVSTITGQIVDSFSFSFVAFIGFMDIAEIIKISISLSLFKTLIALLDTPFIYATRIIFEKIDENKANKNS